MARDSKYLEWHGNQWRARVKVPSNLRHIIGRSKLVHSLHTDSLTEANHLKWPHVATFKATIERARKVALRPDALHSDTVTTEALRVREAVAAEREAPPRVEYGNPWALGQAVIVADEADWAVERAEQIAAKHGETTARRFYNLALGKVLPLSLNLETWLLQSDLAGRTKRDYRNAVRDLKRWCRERNIEETMQAIDRQRAARFITECLLPGRSSRTANKMISALSAYWRWMVKRGEAIDNPWTGQTLPRAKAHRNPDGCCQKRPFTDAEVTRLLTGPADRMLSDLMRIASLSGMRINEICSLRMRDCADGIFTIARAKTAAGRRQVPIHSALQPIIAVRCRAKGGGDLIFHELPPVAPSREEDNRLSEPAGKAFGRYREKLGVDERAPKARQSNIDFHSLRRWFIAKARGALQSGALGFTPWTVADVVGHDRKVLPLGMTFGVYPGPSEMAARRACIEAVKLPPLPTNLPKPPERRRILRVRRKPAVGR